MDVKLLTLLLLLCLVCASDQRRVRHDRGRNGLRRYRSGRHHKGLGRHQGQGRRLAAKRRKLIRMLPYEAEEDVKVRERMNVSLWKLGVRSNERPQSRPKRDVTRVMTSSLIPKLALLNSESGSERSLQRKLLVKKHVTPKTPWPLPQHLLPYPNQIYKINPNDFHFTIPGSLRSCSTLMAALRRYFMYITGTPATHWSVQDRSDRHPKDDHSHLDHVDIKLDSCVDVSPGNRMNEKYALQIKDGTASISSNQVSGILRGLETLSQLVGRDSNTGELNIPGVEVTDSPRNPYRGVVIDTSRHFLNTDNITSILRRMEQNKLNHLHWVLSFGQALNMKQNVSGSDQSYSSKDVNGIVKYARERSIVVVPELNTLRIVDGDIPDITVNCFHGNNNLIYPFIRTAFRNILAAFPESPVLLDKSLPDLKCWKQSPKLRRLMSELRIKDHHLVAFHTERLVDIIRRIDASRTILIYHSNGTTSTNGHSSIVKFRKLEPKSTGNGEEFSLFSWHQKSSSWEVNSGKTNDGPTLSRSNVVGGELHIWGEDVHSTSGLDGAWSPMTTVAGRLWGDPEGNRMTNTGVRVQEHLCRMIRRESLYSCVHIPDNCRVHGL